MEDRIKHFSHHHRLTLRLDADEFCDICGLICKGLRYSCKGCSFLIHRTCAALPREINHPFHPQHSLTLLDHEDFQCHACGKVTFNRYAYSCSDSECKFDLDLNCAALMPTKRTTESSSSSSSHEKECQIDHCVVKPHPHGPHPHPHPLILCKTEKKTNFYCSGCKLVIENGSIYVCIECKSILHKSCSELSQFIKHPFHPHHTLTLLSSSELYFSCNACGGEHDRLTFHCSECKFYLDINCAFLMLVSTTDHHHHQKEEEHQIDHPHPLILCKSSSSSSSSSSSRRTKKKKISFVCNACQLPFDNDGSSMYCCLDCHLLLHKSCAELPDEIQHSFHPDHLLKLMKFNKASTHMCDACLGIIEGFSYDCLPCKFRINIPCALSTPLLVNSQLHEHPLAFFSVVAKDLQCNVCHHIRKSSYFRCLACNFNVHILCIPTLPPTASDGNHRHPLTLTKSQVKDYEDEGEDDAEFYCDRCENKRSLRDPTYYCAECHYVAHVHCVIHEVVRFMEEEWSLAQKLGDKKLATSIDSCQENTNELVSRVLIEKEETTAPLLTNTNLHEHPLTFFRVVVADLCCIVCNSYSHSNFFRCVPCNFNLHLLCISTLPPTILHKSHPHHTLILTCCRVKDWYDDEGNALGRCCACEEERQLCEPTYYCAECSFVAHLSCALPQLAMDEEGSLAHKLDYTKLATSTSSEERSINEVVREVLINFSDFSQRKEDREEAIAVIRVKIGEEEARLEELRIKYVEEQEFKVDALWKRLEALEKHLA